MNLILSLLDPDTLPSHFTSPHLAFVLNEQKLFVSPKLNWVMKTSQERLR